MAETPTPQIVLRQTERLVLRPWRDTDADAVHALNADPVVMEHFPNPFSRDESNTSIARMRAGWMTRGWGFWIVELSAEGGRFGGILGLSVPSFTAPFTPCVEIGWRLARDAWGKGYATEGAREALRFGFEELGLSEIVSFTVPANVRSRAVMERLGMTLSGEFDHPSLAEGHRLRRHVLYRLPRP